MKWYEVRTVFFRPIWRRILVVAAVAIWTVIEVVNEAWFWALLFAGAGIYLSWAFFIAFEDAPAGKEDTE